MERIKESPEKRLNNNNEKQFNEISDEAQHEISMAIHASARQSIRPYNSQVILPGQIRSNNRTRSSTPDVPEISHGEITPWSVTKQIPRTSIYLP